MQWQQWMCDHGGMPVKPWLPPPEAIEHWTVYAVARGEKCPRCGRSFEQLQELRESRKATLVKEADNGD